MGAEVDHPRIVAVGLSAQEVDSLAAALGVPIEPVSLEGAPGLLAEADPELVLLDLDAAPALLPEGRAPVLGPQFLVLYPQERVGEAEGLARGGRVELLSRTGDYLAWLPRFAGQALASGRWLREALGALTAEKHRLEAAIESMSEGLLVVDRDYATATLNPVARELLGVCGLEELAVKLREGEVDPGLHSLFWLEAHGPEAQPLRCWLGLECGREDCPAYGSGLFPCWLYDGTLCHGDGPARFPAKLARCRECTVYTSNAPLADPSRVRGRREVVTERPPERILESISSPIVDETGRCLGVVKLLRDVTTERKLEQVRAQFVEFITHELRTPLTSISGFLWLVLEGHSGDLTEVQRHQLAVAHRQCKRLMGLVDDLLDLSAIETGHLRLTRRTFDIVPLLGETAEALLPQADARDVTLRVAPSDGRVLVCADRIRIGQVLTNLTANAIRYADPGSPVALSARCSADGVCVEVADAGRGVPATDLPHLFDKYYRVHTPDSASRGSGLGLAICRGIICAHGGRIWVESAEGQGARFCFTLPALTPEPEARS